MAYSTFKITPLNKAPRKDQRAISFAVNHAEKSEFTSSLRLGACIQLKGSCFLRE